MPSILHRTTQSTQTGANVPHPWSLRVGFNSYNRHLARGHVRARSSALRGWWPAWMACAWIDTDASYSGQRHPVTLLVGKHSTWKHGSSLLRSSSEARKSTRKRKFFIKSIQIYFYSRFFSLLVRCPPVVTTIYTSHQIILVCFSATVFFAVAINEPVFFLFYRPRISSHIWKLCDSWKMRIHSSCPRNKTSSSGRSEPRAYCYDSFEMNYTPPAEAADIYGKEKVL